MARYLARKARDKFNCEQCIKLWIADEEEKDVLNEQFVFFDNKQYDKTKGGLIRPSKLLLDTTMEMEKAFRCILTSVINGENVLTKVVSVFNQKIQDEVVCSPKCDKAKND